MPKPFYLRFIKFPVGITVISSSFSIGFIFLHAYAFPLSRKRENGDTRDKRNGRKHSRGNKKRDFGRLKYKRHNNNYRNAYNAHGNAARP